MQKEWKTYKLTLMMYLSIILVSISFILTINIFNQIQYDKEILKNAILIDEQIKQIKYYKNLTIKEKYQITSKINAHINNFKSLTNKYDMKHIINQIESNWKVIENKFINNDNIPQNYFSNQNLFIIERTLDAKEKDLINYLYINFAILIILLIALIYSIRTYIYYQINKHSIYDKETNLYNHDYLMAHLKTTCARATRYKYPLSMLSISMKNIDKKTLPEAEYKKLMEMVGDMLLSLTRTSDVACRYNENHLAIILPFTEKENAEILKGRIEETFQKQDFGISTHPEFKLSIVEYEPKESPKDYITRATKVLEAI